MTPFLFQLVYHFLANGLSEQASSILPPFDGNPCISPNIPYFQGTFALHEVCFEFRQLTYVQQHQLLVTHFVSSLVFGHHL
jgi:hypothetical protein